MGEPVGRSGRRDWLWMAVGCGWMSRAARSAPAVSGLFRAAEIHHLVLTVGDLERSGEFYGRLLGAGVIERNERSLILGFERNYLGLRRGERPGMDHFSIAIEGFERQAVSAKLMDAGHRPALKEPDVLVVTDPDGIQVGLCSATHRVGAAAHSGGKNSLFRGIDVNHVALRVAEIGPSRDFYQKLFGLEVASQSSGSCFLSLGGNFLALFRGQPAGQMDHYCISVEGYTADAATAKLTKEGHRVRRTANRIYFPDPDGLTVQLSEADHGP
jgi:catechol 2,3-dioxygenase-like lactoylglutathione lyase family enzyme